MLNAAHKYTQLHNRKTGLSYFQCLRPTGLTLGLLSHGLNYIIITMFVSHMCICSEGSYIIPESLVN